MGYTGGTDIYDTQKKDERNRLNLQASTIADSDCAYINDLVSKKIASFTGEMVEPYTINIVEHGGSTLETRMFIFDMLSKNYPDINFNYINLEHNQEAVNKANELCQLMDYGNIKIDSIQCDLNMENVGDVISSDLNKRGINGADIVLSNYVIQHLASPQHCLKEMQKYMNEDCDVFMRCPDDDFKTINPTSGFSSPTARQAATNIVNLFTGNLKKASDRHLGKKLGDMANSDGFENVQTELYTDQVASDAPQEKKETYLVRDFKWYITVMNDVAKDVPELAPIAQQMEENYQILKKEFLETNCSYIYQEPCVIFSSPQVKLDMHR